jgi:hypothetical protein
MEVDFYVRWDNIVETVSIQEAAQFGCFLGRVDKNDDGSRLSDL